MNRIMTKDTPHSWFRIGTVVSVEGASVTGAIWTGHAMTIEHEPEEFAALMANSEPEEMNELQRLIAAK